MAMNRNADEPQPEGASPWLPEKVLAAVFAECSLRTRINAMRASSSLRDPAAQHIATLAGTTDDLPVPWDAFRNATKLRLASKTQGKSWRLSDADIKLYQQLFSQLPARVEDLALEGNADITFSQSQAKQMVQALAAAPPALAGNLISVTIGHGFSPAAANILLTTMTSLKQLSLHLHDAAMGGVVWPLQPQAELTELHLSARCQVRGRTRYQRACVCFASASSGSDSHSDSDSSCDSSSADVSPSPSPSPSSSSTGDSIASSNLQMLSAQDVRLVQLQHLPGLTHLTASSDHYGERGRNTLLDTSDLAALTSLRHLHLCQDLSSAEWDILARMPQLQELLLRSVSFGQEAAASRSITSLTMLHELGLPPAGVLNEQGQGLLCRLLPALQSLELRELLRGSGVWQAVQPLSAMTNLTSLVITGISLLTTEILADCAACSRLQRLHLELGNETTATGPAAADVISTLLPAAAGLASLQVLKLVSFRHSLAFTPAQVVRMLTEVLPALQHLELDVCTLGAPRRNVWSQQQCPVLLMQLREAGLQVVAVHVDDACTDHVRVVVEEAAGVRRLVCWLRRPCHVPS